MEEPSGKPRDIEGHRATEEGPGQDSPASSWIIGRNSRHADGSHRGSPIQSCPSRDAGAPPCLPSSRQPPGSLPLERWK